MLQWILAAVVLATVAVFVAAFRFASRECIEPRCFAGPALPRAVLLGAHRRSAIGVLRIVLASFVAVGITSIFLMCVCALGIVGLLIVS